MELEDFALGGMEARLAALVKQPGYELLAEQIRSEAHAAGRAEAGAEAEAAREALVAGALAELAAVLGELRAAREQFQRENSAELIRLAAALARRVLRGEPSAAPELLAQRAASCLELLEGDSAYSLRVNPATAVNLAELLQDGGSDPFAGTPWRVLPDPQIPAGGLILEGDDTRIESICEEELARFEAELLARNGRKGEEHGP